MPFSFVRACQQAKARRIREENAIRAAALLEDNPIAQVVAKWNAEDYLLMYGDGKTTVADVLAGKVLVRTPEDV